MARVTLPLALTIGEPAWATSQHLCGSAQMGAEGDPTAVVDHRCRVHGIDRLVVTGQHTDCCCRHTSYDGFARGIQLVVVADATAVYQPFAADDYQQVQNRALQYLRTYYGAEVTDTAALI